MTKEFTRQKSELTARFEKEREEAIDFAHREDELRKSFESDKSDIINEHKRDMLLLKQESAKELSQELAKQKIRLQSESEKARELDLIRHAQEKNDAEKSFREKEEAANSDHRKQIESLRRQWSGEKEQLESTHKFQISKLKSEIDIANRTQQAAELASNEEPRSADAVARVQAKLDALQSEWQFEKSSMQAEWRREKSQIEGRHDKAARTWQAEKRELEARHVADKKAMEEGFQREKSLMRQMFHRESARRFERQVCFANCHFLMCLVLITSGLGVFNCIQGFCTFANTTRVHMLGEEARARYSLFASLVIVRGMFWCGTSFLINLLFCITKTRPKYT